MPIGLVPGEGKAPVAGGEIAYRIAGAGVPIASSHPYWMPRSGYRPLPGFATVTIWPRGFGSSSRAHHRSDYGFWRLAEDIDAVRAHLGLEKWLYWGVSFGGITGLLYALHHPEALYGLILDSTAASWHYTEDVRSIWPQVIQSPEARAFAESPTLETQTAFYRRIGEMGNVTAEGSSRGDAGGAEQNPAALAECVRRLPEFDVREKLRRLKLPILVLAGEEDVLCPPGQAQLIAETAPEAQLHLFSGVGHGVRHHNPSDLVELVTAFIRSVVPDAS